MPINISMLDNLRNSGNAPDHFDFANPFGDKLAATGFGEAWWSLIDGELFKDVEFSANRIKRRLGSARLNDQCRAFFVPYLTRFGKEHLIIVGYLFDHKHETYSPLSDPTCLVDDIEAKIAEIEAQEAEMTQQSQEAVVVTSPVQSPSRRKVQLNQDQLTIKARLLSGEAVVLWGPAGVGKTEIAKALLDGLPSESVLYLVPHRGLCAEIAGSVSVRDNMFIETARMLDKRICRYFAKYNIPSSFLKLEERIPADFTFFNAWWKSVVEDTSIYTELKQKIHSLKINPRLAYQEIIYAILQPRGPTLEKLSSFLSREQYLHGVSEEEAKKRSCIYAIFMQYQEALKASVTHFDPHERLFQVFVALQNVKAQSKAQSREVLKNLFVDFVVMDEYQRANPLLAYIAFFLLSDKNKNHFVCGDPFQDLCNKGLRITQSYRDMMQLFGVSNPTQPSQLDQSFRCSKPVSQLANRLLCLFTRHLGAYLREETFGFRVEINSKAAAIDFECRVYDSAFVESPRNKDADVVVLIPNAADLDEAKCLWPHYSVFYVADFAGLERGRVILFGFGDHYSKELGGLTKAESGMPVLSETPVFSRKHRKEGALIDSELYDVITGIYSGATRSMGDLIFVDRKPHHELEILMGDIKKDNSPAAITAPVAVAPVPSLSSPEDWLATARDYCNRDEQVLVEEGLRILSDARVWGSHVELAKTWLADKNLKNPESRLSVVAQIKKIISSADVAAVLRNMLEKKPVASQSAAFFPPASLPPTQNGTPTKARKHPEQHRVNSQEELLKIKFAELRRHFPDGRVSCSASNAKMSAAMTLLGQIKPILNQLGKKSLTVLLWNLVLLMKQGSSCNTDKFNMAFNDAIDLMREIKGGRIRSTDLFSCESEEPFEILLDRFIENIAFFSSGSESQLKWFDHLLTRLLDSKIFTKINLVMLYGGRGEVRYKLKDYIGAKRDNDGTFSALISAAIEDGVLLLEFKPLLYLTALSFRIQCLEKLYMGEFDEKKSAEIDKVVKQFAEIMGKNDEEVSASQNAERLRFLSGLVGGVNRRNKAAAYNRLITLNHEGKCEEVIQCYEKNAGWLTENSNETSRLRIIALNACGAAYFEVIKKSTESSDERTAYLEKTHEFYQAAAKECYKDKCFFDRCFVRAASCLIAMPGKLLFGTLEFIRLLNNSFSSPLIILSSLKEGLLLLESYPKESPAIVALDELIKNSENSENKEILPLVDEFIKTFIFDRFKGDIPDSLGAMGCTVEQFLSALKNVATPEFTAAPAP